MVEKRSRVKGKRITTVNPDSETIYRHECHDLMAVWMLRILINLNTWKSSLIENDEENLGAIGLTEKSCNKLGRSKSGLIKLLKKTKNKFDKKKIKLDVTTKDNLNWLQKLAGLTDVEIEILLFTICIATYTPLYSIAHDIGILSKSGVIKVLAVILEIPYKDVKKALSAKGNLLNSGLFKLKGDGASDLDSMLLVREGLDDILSIDAGERQFLLNQYFYPSKKTRLKSKDYPHVKKDIKLLKKYLSGALKRKMIGSNILIYGPPGTGKTELVSVLAESLQTQLYQVSIADKDGADYSSSDRLDAYQIAQRVLNKRGGSALLFDEIEDIFPTGNFFGHHAEPGKAWFNNLLETNSTPTFWLSNDIKQIDDAYIRRFDYVLELKLPPRSVRKNIFKNNLDGLNVSEHWIDQMSKDKQLAPGLISRAAKMVTSISDLDKHSLESSMEQILGNTLRAMGKRIQKIDMNKSTLDYQLDALNPTHDIGQLLEGLKNVAGARLCMYGPPGTGKTAFGHYISKVLDKPLIVKRASDILSPYVGVAEMNMAAMFEEARDEGAVLLLDEADSFLQDRLTLKQSWEVSQVNELLTQMEAFEGLFICSTNLMDKLDTAVLRRFDFKIKLDYLQAEQAWKLFCNALGWNKKKRSHNSSWQQKLSAYNTLTPGDFANVLRQHRLYSRKLTADELMNGLEKESTFKKDTNQSKEIGFHALH